MLKVTGLDAGYGDSQVLQGVDLELAEGEVVALLGRNGMGKSTTIHCICGLLPVRRGTIKFNGTQLHRLPEWRIARQGIGLVPEGRRIFPNLSVEENLQVAAANHQGLPKPWSLEEIYRLFPRLRERQRHRGDQLSGGEQQMLAIARALMINPRLLILDEATEGLAPLIRDEIWGVIDSLKQRGQSILIVDKNLNRLLRLSDRYYLMEKGRIVSTGSAESLLCDRELQARYLGI